MDKSYLAPPCRPSTLDSFGNRRLILRALQEALPQFTGTVLDVGCGHMPYRSLLLAPPSGAKKYVGIDLPNNAYGQPDLEWDGKTIPAPDSSFDSIVLTEVLEHCPDPGIVLREVNRVMKPGAFLFLTVPFIWPIHCVPYDEFRYTPFSLDRLLSEAGFTNYRIDATGGRHAVLSVTLGLWVRRRPVDTRVQRYTRRILSLLLWPIIWMLFRLDRIPQTLGESTLLVGLKCSARKQQ